MTEDKTTPADISKAAMDVSQALEDAREKLAREKYRESKSKSPNHESVLERAKGVRNTRDQHGDPVETHEKIADMWSAYLGVDIDAVDAANMMILHKLSRAHCGFPATEHYEDIAGYADIADLIENDSER